MKRPSLHAWLPALLLALAACKEVPPTPVADFTVTGVKADADGRFQVATGAQVRLDGTASTPATGARFAWRLSRRPGGSQAAIDLPDKPAPSFLADATGEFEVELVIRTDFYESPPKHVLVQATLCGANVPTAGTLVATPSSPSVGAPVKMSATGVADADNTTCGQDQLLSWQWSFTDLPAGSQARLADPTGISPGFTPDVPGDYTVQLVVTDSTGRSSPAASLKVTAALCGSNPPVIDTLVFSPPAPGAGTPVGFTATVHDDDLKTGCALPQTIAYAWTLITQPPGSAATLNSTTITSPTLVPDLGGTYVVRLQLTDSTGRASAPRDVTVIASACGRNPPVPRLILPASASLGTPVLLQVQVTDEDVTSCSLQQSFAYAWQLVQAPAGSLAALNAPASASPSFVPDVPGAYGVRLVVTDSGGVSSSPVSAVITASACNGSAPSIDDFVASPAAPNGGQQIRVTPFISDADAACSGFTAAYEYTWQLEQRPPGSAALLRDPAASTADFLADLPGPYLLSLSVRAPNGLAGATRRFTVNAASCGFAAPSVDAVAANPAAPDPGVAVALSATVSDADAAAPCNLTVAAPALRWSVLSRPSGSRATLSDPLATSPKLTPDKPGLYQLQVTATDGSGLRSAPAFVSFTASTCGTAAPTVTAAPASVAVRVGQSVPLTATPASGNSLCGGGGSFAYRWAVETAPAASGATLSDPGIATPGFAPDLPGAYVLSVVATDANGLSSAKAFVRITADTCALLPPHVDGLAAVPGAGGFGLGKPLTLQAVIVDQNCAATGAPKYSWTLAQRPPQSRASLSNPAAAAPVLTPDVAGNYLVQLVVLAPSGLSSDTGELVIQVPGCTGSAISWNGTPQISLLAANEPDGTPFDLGAGPPHAGAQVQLTAPVTVTPPSCTALPVTPLRWRWAVLSRPAGSTAALSDPTAPQPWLVPDLPGDYRLAVQVTDALGTVSPIGAGTLSTSTCGTGRPALQAIATTPAGVGAVNLQRQLSLYTDASSPDAACPARFRPLGNAFDFRWSLASSAAPGGATLSPATGKTTSFRATVPGTYLVQADVSDPNDGLAGPPRTLAITALPCGASAPAVVRVDTTVAGVPGAFPQPGQPVTLTAVAADPDAACIGSDAGGAIANVTWRLLSTPAGSAYDLAGKISSSGTGAPNDRLSLTPDVAGSYVVQATAWDDTGLASAPFLVTIKTAACRPSLASITVSPSPAVIGGAVALDVPRSGGQPVVSDACVGSPSFSGRWTLLSAPAGSQTAFADASALATSITPDLPGSYLVQLEVRDQAGNAAPAVATAFTATPCGLAGPTLGALAASKATPDTGDQVALSISGISNPNGACGLSQVQPYAYRWSLLEQPAASSAALSDPAAASPVLVPDAVGAYTVQVEVTDALGNSSTSTPLTLQTSQCGANLPTASIRPLNPDPLQAGANQPLALTSVAADADSSCPARFHTPAIAFAYQWAVTGAPAGAQAVLSTPAASATTFTATAPGDYLLELVVTASTGLRSLPDRRTVHVSTCGAATPEILSVVVEQNGSPVSRPALGPVQLVASGHDADGDPGGGCGVSPVHPLTYAWTLAGAPAGSAASAAAQDGSASLSFTADRAGTYAFDVVATDPGGLRSPAFRVLVPTGACGPGLASIAAAPSSASVGGAVALSHTPAGALSSACVLGGAVALHWSIASRPAGSSAALSSDSADAPTFTPDRPGSYQLQLTATDAGGFSTSATTTVVAGSCAQQAAPWLISQAVLPLSTGRTTPFLGEAVRLSAAFPGPGPGCAASAPASPGYHWTLVSGPAGSAAALTGAATATPSLTADVPGGSWQVELVVDDGAGGFSPPAFALVTASTCGAKAPAVALGPAAPSAGVNAPIALSATATDQNATDQNAAACPASLRTPASGFGWSWAVTSAPAGATASLVAAGAGATFSAGTPGSYRVAATATDLRGLKGAQELAITVTDCGARLPLLAGWSADQPSPIGPAAHTDQSDPAPPQFLARLPIALAAAAVDPNAACGAPLPVAIAWSLAGKPAGSAAALQPAGAAASFTPDLPGAYAIAVDLTNAAGLARTVVPLTVSSCGASPPSIQDAGGSGPKAWTASQTLWNGALRQHTSAGGPPLAVGLPVSLAANVADADSLPGCGLPDLLAYRWQLAATPVGSAARLSDAAAAEPSFTPDLAGTYRLALTVTDSTGLSASAAIALDATCGVAPPQAQDQAGVAAAFAARQVLPLVNTTAGPIAGFVIQRATTPAALDTAASVPFYPGVPVQLSSAAVEPEASTSCALDLPIRYAWRLSAMPAGSRAAVAQADTAAASFTPDLPGEYDVELVLSNASGASRRQVFSTNLAGKPFGKVGSCGLQPPVPSVTVTTAPGAGPYGPGTSPAFAFLGGGAQVSFDASATSSPDAALLSYDPAGVGPTTGCGLPRQLQYAWTFTELPATSAAAFTGAALPLASFAPDLQGVYGVSLVATDESGTSAAVRVPVSVQIPTAARTTLGATPAGPVRTTDAAGYSATLTVLDAVGLPVQGQHVDFSLPAAPTGFSNSVSPASGVTGADGKLTTTVKSTAAVSVLLTASLPGRFVKTQSLAFVPGPPSALRWTAPPSSPQVAGAVLAPAGPATALTVGLFDQPGNPVTAALDCSYSVHATIATDGAAHGTSTLGGTKTQPAAIAAPGAPCEAQFPDLTIDKRGSGFVLSASGTPGSGLPAVTAGLTPAFAINATGAPPQAPGAVTASGPPATDNRGTITLTVTPPSPLGTAVSYLITSSPTSVEVPAGGLVVPIAPTVTVGAVTPLADATRYSFTVFSEDASGQDSAGSVSASAFTTPSAPAITSTVPTDAQITVNWTAPASGFGSGTAVAYYQVARATQLDLSDLATISGLLPTSQASYLDNSPALAPGTTYYYVVFAGNDGGRRPSPQSAATALVPPPAPPTGLTALGGNSIAVLNWVAPDPGTPANPATHYNVYLGSVAPANKQNAGVLSATTFQVNGLINGNPVTLLVTALNQFEEESAAASAPVTPNAPAAPTGLNSVGASGSVVLSWTNDPKDTGYAVVRSAAADCSSPTALGTFTGSPLVDTPPAAGTVFYYCVTGVNATVPTPPVATAVVSGEIGDPNATCTSSTTGAPACTCNPGFNGNGLVCLPLGMAAGPLHACAIAADQTMSCWGVNASGQLGVAAGDTTDRAQRTAVANVGTGKWRSVAAGLAHTCGVQSDNTLWCWGDNTSGQVGTNSNTNSFTTPQKIVGANDWQQVAAGGNSACAVKSTSNTSVFCWGDTSAGQDGGNGNPAIRKQPTAVSLTGSSLWAAVAVGDDHVCALKTAGGSQLWCWGQNGQGQVGQAAGGGIFTPARVGSASDWGTISAGHLGSCSVRTGANAGKLFCWGAPVGDFNPTQVGADADWASASLGDGTLCGVKRATGLAFCGGANDHGQLGRGTIDLTPPPGAPAQVGSATSYSAAVTRHFTSCALRSADSIPECWGGNDRGQLGINLTGRKLTPTQVGAGTDWRAVFPGAQNNCGLRDPAPTSAQRTLWCAGLDASGEAGQGIATPFGAFTQAGADTDWGGLAAGPSQFLGFKASAATFFWGSGANNLRGDGSAAGLLVPTAITQTYGAGPTTLLWQAVSAGDSSACAIEQLSGNLFCWGANTQGEAGGITGTAIPTPLQFGANTWSQISLGGTTACGIDAGSNLWCWGNNANGRAAKSSGGPFNTAQQVTTPAALGWTAVATGSDFSCAINSGGLYCWGNNTFGQLSTGNNNATSTPTKVGGSGGNTTYTVVGAGQASACAYRTSDSRLYCWGHNNVGQLGDGTTTDRNDHAVIDSGHTWLQVAPAHVAAAASGYTCAVRSDGTLWCWGSNEYGWHGDDTGFRLTPTATLP